ncbi:MAG: DUF4416 family protein [candidate division WOR-3 bacterium]
MSKIFLPAKIILGVLTKEVKALEEVLKELKADWGEIDLQSEIIPFSFTNYYEEEMGKELFRLWVAFQKIFPAAAMKELKIKTIEIEKKFLNEKGGRIFNLDPGIITLSNLCLLTHKNYAHRIYLGDGIFCELTLLYRSGKFSPLPWTYPDYQTETALKFFQKVREKLLLAKEG